MKAITRQVVLVFSTLALALTCASTALAVSMTPIGVSGFNADLVVEVGASAPDGVDTLFDYLYDPSLSNVGTEAVFAFYEQGRFSSHPTYGLPSGTTASQYDANTTYQLAPFNSQNAILVDADATDTTYQTGTLTLNAAARYSKLAVFAVSGQGSKTISYTLNYSDATTSTGSLTVGDWFGGGTNVAIMEHSRARCYVEGGDMDWVIDPATESRTDGANIYQLNVTDVDPAKYLTSITFAGVTTGYGGTAVFGVSGSGVVPEPSTIALLIAGLASLAAHAWRKRK